MFNKKALSLLLFTALLFTSLPGFARYPFYIGLTGGYGSTTWQQLSPRESEISEAVSMCTPVGASEGGAVGGGFIGYELIPDFALELSYFRYPDAIIQFDPSSLFAFNNDGLTELTSHTETYSLMGKIMLLIPHTGVRAYSSAGVSGVHRYDNFLNRWRASPTFGVGINYNVIPHILLELGFNYTGGYGESELEPAKDYVPFLYSLFLGIAYRF